jgi:peroxiredoxin family protein
MGILDDIMALIIIATVIITLGVFIFVTFKKSS